MMAEFPDQFVDYMVMNQIILDLHAEETDDDLDPETFLNNYVTTTGPQETGRPLVSESGGIVVSSPPIIDEENQQDSSFLAYL